MASKSKKKCAWCYTDSWGFWKSINNVKWWFQFYCNEYCLTAAIDFTLSNATIEPSREKKLSEKSKFFKQETVNVKTSVMVCSVCGGSGEDCNGNICLKCNGRG